MFGIWGVGHYVGNWVWAVLRSNTVYLYIVIFLSKLPTYTYIYIYIYIWL